LRSRIAEKEGTVNPSDRRFFQRDPLTCARELIGCELVWNECAGIIVETEAYAALGDEAAHTFSRPSARAFVANHQPGAAYVYFNYGMYWLLNVLVKGGSHDGFVLFRAIEPTRGIELMTQRRRAHRNSPIAHPRALCSGPGKLTIALGVTGQDHGRDLCAEPAIGFRPRAGNVQVQSDVRIGISKAAHFPWRFLLRGSPFVSALPRRKK
jgi:DNA-3-methyladenine glycosylase